MLLYYHKAANCAIFISFFAQGRIFLLIITKSLLVAEDDIAVTHAAIGDFSST